MDKVKSTACEERERVERVSRREGRFCGGRTGERTVRRMRVMEGVFFFSRRRGKDGEEEHGRGRGRGHGSRFEDRRGM